MIYLFWEKKSEENVMNKDLTTGKPSTVLWQFCLPLFGSIIFQQLYNIADSLVAGKFVGENALAAVGNSYEVTLIFIAFAFGCNIGCSVIVSQLFGAKDFKFLKTAVYTTLISSGVLCALLMLLGFLFCEPLLTLIQTPAELMADSLLYLRIYIAGLPFLFFYNVATGIFSALGDSKTPFWFLAISSTANILVDILFVTAFAMGISGVAWATFLCQGVSCVLAITVVLKRLKELPVEGKTALFSWRLLGRIAVIAADHLRSFDGSADQRQVQKGSTVHFLHALLHFYRGDRRTGKELLQRGRRHQCDQGSLRWAGHFLYDRSQVLQDHLHCQQYLAGTWMGSYRIPGSAFRSRSPAS